ncbi:hypothetical protein HK102_006758, partial [Quaeritorhiza haematococci]
MSTAFKNKILQLEDLWDVNPEERMENSLCTFETLREKHFPRSSCSSSSPKPQKKQLHLLHTLWIQNRHLMIIQFFCAFSSSLLYFSGPFFLNRILEFLESERGTYPSWIAYAYVFAMFVTAVMRFVLEGQASLLGQKASMRIRNVLVGFIYRKALRRIPRLSTEDVTSTNTSTTTTNKNKSEKKEKKPAPDVDPAASVGKIVNLMSVDADKIGEWAGYLYTPLITLLQILLCILTLFLLLGWPALFGITIMTFMLFAGAPLASKINTSFTQTMLARDTRTNAMNELMGGIRIVKFMAWEGQFREKIVGLREGELGALRRAMLFAIVNRVCWYSTPIVVSVVTFASYTKLAGRELTATVAFTSLALFNLLRVPLQLFPDTVIQLLDAWVSIKRIRKFLGEEELEGYEDEYEGGANGGTGTRASTTAAGSEGVPVVGFRNATFEWHTKDSSSSSTTNNDGEKKIGSGGYQQVPTEEEEVDVGGGETGFQLRDLNVDFPVNKLTIVCGATGSGKTSLLMALLG